MRLEKVIIEKWKKDIEFCLPGLLAAIEKQKSKTFLIGACIFDVYQMQGWLKKFSRRTGDADFTIEYFGNPFEYQTVCNDLLKQRYKRDDIHPYRYHPQKVNGAYAYVDFLTFTTDPLLEKQAKTVMLVGESFNFEGMAFAKHNPLYVENNIYIPNPLALIYLKMRSYYHNPERQKDFVDVVEVILRLSMESNIMNDLKGIMENSTEFVVKQQIERMCFDIEHDRGGLWDLDNIKIDLDERALLDEFEWDTIPTTFEFFRMKILKP